MAHKYNYEEKEFLMGWPLQFQRTNDLPLDPTSVYTSEEDAEKYAKGDEGEPDTRGYQGTSYNGQILAVADPTSGTATPYIISEDKLEEIITKSSISTILSNELKSLTYNDRENDELQVNNHWLLYCVATKTPYYFHGYPVQVIIEYGEIFINDDDTQVRTKSFEVTYIYQYQDKFVKIPNVLYRNGEYTIDNITSDCVEHQDETKTVIIL